ncbi:unnamed protein product [Trichobilharzia regenti]|nr:unnamed protein product [Trichobilharzia regenti]
MVSISRLKMQMMVHLNYYSYMLGIQQRFPTFHGMLMIHGLFVLFLRIIFYKFGKWSKYVTLDG